MSFWSLLSVAKVEVLFHPADPTLEKIATWFQQAKHTIDISMYDLETGTASPVMAALADPAIQARLSSGALSIRMIYEGYDTKQGNAKKMAQLEALGIDVRFVTSSKIVHHKFAVIDASLPESRVVTGSANWSLSSYRNYDENVLFFEQEAFVTNGFETEFELLWTHSTEFGVTKMHPVINLPVTDVNPNIDLYFNSAKHILKDASPEHSLPSQLIKQIGLAHTDLLIATTRARIIPVLESIRTAAERGVKIKILLSQDDFHDLAKRSQWLFNQPNIELRIKFYNLVPGNFMTYQMHNKFMIIDHQSVFTGSFNWSDSSQNYNIENVVLLKGAVAAAILPNFINRFDLLWKNGRDRLAQFQNDLKTDQANHVVPLCAFAPISLTFDEITTTLQLAPKCHN